MFQKFAHFISYFVSHQLLLIFLWLIKGGRNKWDIPQCTLNIEPQVTSESLRSVTFQLPFLRNIRMSFWVCRSDTYRKQTRALCPMETHWHSSNIHLLPCVEHQLTISLFHNPITFMFLWLQLGLSHPGGNQWKIDLPVLIESSISTTSLSIW